MLINLLPHLNKLFNIVVVTLTDHLEFSDEEIKSYARYNLNHTSFKDFPKSIIKLKKVIKKHNPDLVHTQLYQSTILGRICTPSKIPFVFSIHSFLSKDAFEANKFSLYIERLTYNRRQAIISVSEAVFKDYTSHVRVTGKHFILNNFVSKNFFDRHYVFEIRNFPTIKLVAVGNLIKAKNYKFVLQVIKEVKDKISITLDIIGEGDLRNDLEQFINTNKLPVKLLGSRSDVDILLPNYDGLIMCSHHEGFGNAPVEAMAVGLPLILNDLDVMKEMSKGNALFYKSNDVRSLVRILLEYNKNKKDLIKLSEQGKLIAREYYSPDSYFLRLKSIYDELMVK